MDSNHGGTYPCHSYLMKLTADDSPKLDVEYYYGIFTGFDSYDMGGKMTRDGTMVYYLHSYSMSASSWPACNLAIFKFDEVNPTTT